MCRTIPVTNTSSKESVELRRRSLGVSGHQIGPVQGPRRDSKILADAIPGSPPSTGRDGE
ncbi:hypothetical protein [Kibdelosporangium philippinense]|uniref:hypothetical protein n=1 Tax=Kibdelosporangium philippinense TaxID=211113 RepID=UPI003622EF40